MRAVLVASILAASILAGCASVEPVQSHEPCPEAGGPRGGRMAAVDSMDLPPTAFVIESMQAFDLKGGITEPDIRSDGDGGEVWSWGRPGDDLWATARVRDGNVVMLDMYIDERPYADGGAKDAVFEAMFHFGVDKLGEMDETPYPVFRSSVLQAGRLAAEDMPFANSTGFHIEPFLELPPFTLPLQETSQSAHRAAMCHLARQGAFMAASGLSLIGAHEAASIDRVLERVYVFGFGDECNQVRVHVDARSGVLVSSATDPC